MPGVADLALGLAPIAGGMALGAAAGYLKGPDVRRAIKQDMELLKDLPPEQLERRTELQRSIDTRIDDLIAATNRYRSLRRAAGTYQGSLRDVLLLVCAILFTGIWWSTDHHKSNWLPMFVVLIVVSVWAAAYALRGLHIGVVNFIRRQDRHSAPPQP
ncbi:hypothetical protein [Mycobacterium sp. M23085]|uniref:hypothetical protein n=1 Tax=Mycobacterium sp. M23085 TaxID=3378087 RepID=UPI0038780014